MYYYDYSGHALVSLSPLSGFGPEVPPVTQGHLFAPVAGDPVLGRGSFKVNCPGQLRAPHGLEVLDADLVIAGPIGEILGGVAVV